MAHQKWLTVDQAAKYLGSAPSSLYQLKHKNEGPKYYQPGGIYTAIRYRASDLDAWLEGETGPATEGPVTEGLALEIDTTKRSVPSATYTGTINRLTAEIATLTAKLRVSESAPAPTAVDHILRSFIAEQAIQSLEWIRLTESQVRRLATIVESN